MAPTTAPGSPKDEVLPGVIDWKDRHSPVAGMPSGPRKPVEEVGGRRLGATDNDNGKFTSGTAKFHPGHDQAVGGGVKQCLGKGIRSPGGGAPKHGPTGVLTGPSKVGKGTGSG